MRYPGYLLNPGDMFQVEPERVMFATGATKGGVKAKATEDSEDADEAEESEQPQEDAAEADAVEEVDIERDPREVLKDLLAQSKSILASPREALGAKKKQDLRAFSSAVKRMLSRSQSNTTVTDNLEAQFLELQNQLKLQRENKARGKQSLPSQQRQQPADEDAAEGEAIETQPDAENTEAAEPETEINTITDREYNELFAALTEMQENPVDDSKPYATPWMPRNYMSAFAFIPRYLEVNQNICAAVYLRHPVARPGLGEVPTPFNESTNASAFGWYLRRR